VTRAGRAALAVVGLAQAEVGAWGEAAPHSFYASFPGFGHHWVAAMGAYDEHLVRDYAACELGFAVLLVCAAIWSTRQVVLIAGAAFLVGTLPHFAYHLTTTSMLSTTDNVASIGSFVVEMTLVAAAMAAVSTHRLERIAL
jgi:hypothetical protein